MSATRIAPSVRPSAVAPGKVAREFRRLLASGARLRPAGEARRDPGRLLTRAYTPRHKIALFGTDIYLSGVRQNPDIRFFVAFLARPRQSGTDVFPRIFYKDVSLVWRSASHFVQSEAENWIGKGDLRTVDEGDDEVTYAAEATTDLPFEIQTALEIAMRHASRIPRDTRALGLVLRRGPNHRIAPYRDFTEPRRRANADPHKRIHGGESIAWFARANDPASLRFARGFEPDFAAGILEVAASKSRLYGGRLRRFRISSRNRKVQYLFFAGPRHVWLAPPQATTAEITSYGVRAIDVIADEDLSIPGYEYHFVDDGVDPPELVSQIPDGFAGPPSEVDPSRADASAWLDRLPVIREFRRKVLARR